MYLPEGLCQYAPESGCSTPGSVWRSQELARSAALNTKHTPATSWLRGWKKVPWIRALFGRIYTPSMAALGVERWTSSWADTPASPSVRPGSASVPTTRATSGLASRNSSERSSPPGASSKTSAATSPSASTSSIESFKSLVTRLKLDFSARKKLARATVESDSSSSQWQTIGTDSFRCRGGDRKDEMGLDQEARNWPTPFGFQAGNGPDGNEFSKEVRRVVDSWPTPNTAPDAKQLGSNQVNSPPSLGEAAKQWPTPAASAPNVDEAPASWLARREKLKEKGINGNGAGMPLGVASQLWATPRHRVGTGDTGSPERQLEGTNPGLNDQATMWATPIMHNDRGGPKETPKSGGDLSDQSQAWPTPASRDYRTPNSKESEDRRFATTMKGKGQQLQNFVEHSPSSPLARVISVSGDELSPTDRSTVLRRRLNPAFVCWLMGWPWWWTNPARNNSVRAATGSYLFKLRLRLWYLLARYERFLGSESKACKQSY